MTIRPCARRRRGVSLVESSVGLIFLLFVSFGIIEYGQLILARQMMTNAARTAARAAAAGRQPSTYPDGTAAPAPGGVVTTAFLTTWVTKALAKSPLTGIDPRFYGSNADGTANTSSAWDAMAFSRGIFVDIRANYVPLFSGNRFVAAPGGATGPVVGAAAMRARVCVRAEANN